jgi:hypothetical protein
MGVRLMDLPADTSVVAVARNAEATEAEDGDENGGSDAAEGSPDGGTNA